MGNSWEKYKEQCNERNDQIVKLALEGNTIREIAPKFGLTYGRIDQILRQKGIKVPLIKGTRKFNNMVDKISKKATERWKKRSEEKNKDFDIWS